MMISEMQERSVKRDTILSNMQELGLDCVAWNPSVYHDLLRTGDGTAEGIVASYFGMVIQCCCTVTGCCTVEFTLWF